MPTIEDLFDHCDKNTLTIIYLNEQSLQLEEWKKFFNEIYEGNNEKYKGSTLLHYLCRRGIASTEVYKFIIQYYENINALGEYNQTPLHDLCKNEPGINKEILSLLIENGANTNAIDSFRNRPFEYLCKSKRVSVDLLSLFEKELSSNALIISPLFLFLYKFTRFTKEDVIKTDALKYLIKQCASNLNQIDFEGNTALHRYLKNLINNYDVVDLTVFSVFLANGADLKLKDLTGKTPWYYLFELNNFILINDIVELLCDKNYLGKELLGIFENQEISDNEKYEENEMGLEKLKQKDN